MKTYTYSEARNRLAQLLEEAKREEVIIRRRSGETFALVARTKKRRSPFDVPAVGNGITRRGLLAALRESRRSRPGAGRRT